MSAILIVDDSDSVRTALRRNLRQAGHEIEEARDGDEGLVRLSARSYDVVLLDIRMPVRDGPAMLAEMRSRGDTTPVIMLTAEAKSSTVATLMKLGISDYVLKPCDFRELSAKIGRVAAGRKGGAEESPEPPKDLLVVDKSTNVYTKLGSLLPPEITMASAFDTTDALALCRKHAFRVVFVEASLPGAEALPRQLHALSPGTRVFAMVLHGGTFDTAAHGFTGVVRKPFVPAELDEIGRAYITGSDAIVVEDSAVRVPAPAAAERIERYLGRMTEQIDEALGRVAAACYEVVILDLARMPVAGERMARWLIATRQRAARLGLRLSLVCGREAQAVFRDFADTADLPTHPSVEAARRAVAA